MSPRPNMSEVSALLAMQARSVAAELLPHGRMNGRHWVARCPWRDDRSPGSFIVDVSGQRAGRWKDFATGEHGDLLDLVERTLGMGRGDALRWGMIRLGMSGDDRPRPARAAPVAPPEAAPAAPDPSKVWSRGMARTLWREAVPDPGPVAAYLQSRKGLLLPADAPLRFHPSAWRNSANGPRGPAMIALMTNAVSNEPCGVRVTYLRPGGAGKAAGENPKVALGDVGVIRLVPDEDVTTGLGIAEGVETSLAVMQRAGWRPVWAAGDAGAIGSFPVLRGIESLTVFADVGSAGMNNARACCQRWADAGREARLLAPPTGDWDDALPAEEAA